MAFSHHSKQYEPKVISYWNHFTRTHLQHRQRRTGIRGRRGAEGCGEGGDGEDASRHMTSSPSPPLTSESDGVLLTGSAKPTIMHGVPVTAAYRVHLRPTDLRYHMRERTPATWPDDISRGGEKPC
jgi:hypothetical protein